MLRAWRLAFRASIRYIPDMQLISPICRFFGQLSAAYGKLLLLTALTMAAVPIGQVRADAVGDWPEKRFSEIRLLAARAGTADSAQLLGGIEITTRPGWKTYWRAAGEAGLPPQFNWLSVENAQLPEILWPVPMRFVTDGLESYGYDDGVLLPFHIVPDDPTKPVRLHLQARYAVCLEICVPEQAELTLTVSPQATDSGPEAAAKLNRALQQVPRLQSGDATTDLPMMIESVALVETASSAMLVVTARSQTGFVAPDLFIDGAGDFLFGMPEIALAADGAQASFTVPVNALVSGMSLKGLAARLTLTDQGAGIDYSTVISN